MRIGCSKIESFEEPELWAEKVCCGLATLLLVTAGHQIEQINQLITELVNHDFFVQHILEMNTASSMLVLKAMSELSAAINERQPDIKENFKNYLEDNLDCRLELNSEICEDLATNLDEDV